MKFGTVSAGRYTGADRYTAVAVGRRSTVYIYIHLYTVDVLYTMLYIYVHLYRFCIHFESIYIFLICAYITSIKLTMTTCN